MGKIVLFDIGDGDFRKGFSVTAHIYTETQRKLIGNAKGKLPNCSSLYRQRKKWLQLHEARVNPIRSANRISASLSPNPSIDEIREADQDSKIRFNNWLNSDLMFPILLELTDKLKHLEEEIRFICQTEDQRLQILPWHSWSFLNKYSKAEVGLYLPVRQQIIMTPRPEVKLLAVFGKIEVIGDIAKINTEKDWKALERHLSEKSNTKLIRLDQPTLKELCEELARQCPQILFFAGHSSSEDKGSIGKIELNHEETITIDDFKPYLREAVKQGLQLAIFNSCQGWGIAKQLAELHIPYIITMRASVPDEVAQDFLQYFLKFFAAGNSLHVAVGKARGQISYLNPKFPGATELPISWHNPAEPPLTLQRLGGTRNTSKSNRTNPVSEQSQPDVENNTESSQTNPVSEQSQPDVENNTESNQTNPVSEQSQPSFEDKSESNQTDPVSEQSRPDVEDKNESSQTDPVSEQSQPDVEDKSESSQTDPVSEQSRCKHQGSMLFPNQQSTECRDSYGIEPQQLNRTHLSTLTSKGLSLNPNPANSISNRSQVTTSTVLLEKETILRQHFKIIETLVQGGFSRTYLAEDLDLPDQPPLSCVVKQLQFPNNDPLLQEKAKGFFRQEAASLRILGEHNQIPRLLARFEENQQMYLVQEFIEGINLRDELQPGKQMSESYVK